MKNIQVFEGHELKTSPPSVPATSARCHLRGIDPSSREILLPFNDDLFSRHVLLLGGIGTGKTNAIFQNSADQLRKSMTQNDVMLIFDTKGDYYQEFFRKGDIVISNDDKATGPEGPNYWNIFREVGQGEELEENLIEITRTLFYERTQRSNQPFFPNAARDLLTAILLHFSRSNDQANTDNAHLRAFLDRTPSAELRNILQSHDDLKAITGLISQMTAHRRLRA